MIVNDRIYNTITEYLFEASKTDMNAQLILDSLEDQDYDEIDYINAYVAMFKSQFPNALDVDNFILSRQTDEEGNVVFEMIPKFGSSGANIE